MKSIQWCAFEGCSKVDDAPLNLTDVEAAKLYQEHDGNPDATHVERCQIHTHPAFRAYMSKVNIYQMYRMEKSGPLFSFSMVFSPRCDGGLKVLGVRLTQAGIKEKDKFHKQSQGLKTTNSHHQRRLT